MSHFYGSMQGCRKEVTRTGTKNSGLTAHVRGWSLGLRAGVVHFNGEDIVSVELTSGSDGTGRFVHLGDFKRADFDRLFHGEE